MGKTWQNYRKKICSTVARPENQYQRNENRFGRFGKLSLRSSGTDSSDKEKAREAFGIDLNGLNKWITEQISHIKFADIREIPISLEAYGITDVASKNELIDGLAAKAEIFNTHAIDDITGLQNVIDNVSFSSEKVTGALGYIPYDGKTNSRQFATKTYVDETV